MFLDFLGFFLKFYCLQEIAAVYERTPYCVLVLHQYTLYCLHTSYRSWHTTALYLSDKLT